MNLYKLLVEHASPKDSITAIRGYLLANNEEEVYAYVDSKFNYDTWSDRSNMTWEDYKEENDLDDEDKEYYEESYGEGFRNSIIETHGEIDQEDKDYSDAYYGVRFDGWELVKEGISTDEQNVLLSLNISEIV